MTTNMTKDYQPRAVTPYLFFGGNCAEALDFYQKALGAKINMVMKHRDNPQPSAECPLPAGYEDKIMHAEMVVRGTAIMASDGYGEPASFQGFSLSLTLPEHEIESMFNALATGGTITMPLQATFWTSRFGMLTDQFGVNWMLMVPEAIAA